MSPLHIFFALLVAFAWGANFIAAKWSVLYMPPIMLTAMRFFVVAAVILPFVKRPQGKEWRIVIHLAAALGLMHFSLMYWSLAEGLDVPSASVIAQMGVPFSCLLGAIFLKDYIGSWRALGILLSLVGVFVIAGTPDILKHPLALVLALSAAFCFGWSNIVLKSASHMGPMRTLGWMGIFAVPMLLTASWVLEGAMPYLHELPTSFWAAFFYTVIGSTLIGHALWYFLMSKYPVSQVAPFCLLVPLFATVLAVLVLDEPLTWQALLGGALTIAGVGIIILRRPKLVGMGDAV